MTSGAKVENIIAELRERILSNINYMKLRMSPNAARFTGYYNEIQNNVTSCIPILRNINEHMERFDYDAEHKGNGYRSLFNYYIRMILKLLLIVDKIKKHTSSLLIDLPDGWFLDEVRAWTKLTAEMGELLKLGKIYLDNTNANDLLIPFNESTGILDLEIANTVACMDAFLDHPLGFQYADSLAFRLNIFASVTAVYYDSTQKNEPHSSKETFNASIFKYMVNPELRASKVHEAFMHADVLFHKSLESNSGDSAQMPDQNTIDKVITLEDKRIIMSKENTKCFDTLTSAASFEILLPQVNGVIVKCIANRTNDYTLGKRQVGEIESETQAPAVDTIMFHIHGGGFVTEDSQSKFYLQMWLKELGIPICSMQYSLSPDATFPQALEECYYAYAWILENKPLGWSGKRIIFVGDSAGGNLITSLVVKCIMTNLRLPNAIFPFYPLLCITNHQVPSRLLSAVDPIINTPAMNSCTMAYCGIKVDEYTDEDTNDTELFCENMAEMSKKTSEEAEKLKRKFRAIISYPRLDDPLLSPIFADEVILKHFPFTYIFACECDPLLDDSVILAKILRKVGVKHEILIVPEVPHGFLSFAQGSSLCCQVLKMTTKLMMDAITSLENK